MNYRVFPASFPLTTNEFWYGFKIVRNDHHHPVTTDAHQAVKLRRG